MKEVSKVKQTNKAKQHSTPKAVTFPKKNELPQVGLEPMTLSCTLTPTDHPLSCTLTPTDHPLSCTLTPTDHPLSCTLTPTDHPLSCTLTPTDHPLSCTLTPTDRIRHMVGIYPSPRLLLYGTSRRGHWVPPHWPPGTSRGLHHRTSPWSPRGGHHPRPPSHCRRRGHSHLCLRGTPSSKTPRLWGSRLPPHGVGWRHHLAQAWLLLS